MRMAATTETVTEASGDVWETHEDPATGNRYFLNTSTGESRWPSQMEDAAVGASPASPAGGGSWLGTLLFVVFAAAAAFGATALPADHAVRAACPFEFPATDVAALKLKIADVLATAEYRVPPASPAVEAVDDSALPSASDVAGAGDGGVLARLRAHQKKTAAAFSVLALMPLYNKLVAPN